MPSVRGTVKISIENCKGCELCIDACPQESLLLSHHINKRGYHFATLVKDNCTGCVNCALVCPDAAITVYRTRKSGARVSRQSIIASQDLDGATVDVLPTGRVVL